MRCGLLVLMVVVMCAAAPQSKLQTGSQDTGSQQLFEEVVVESTLHIRTPTNTRQARTNTQTSLKDGARVAEMNKN